MRIAWELLTGLLAKNDQPDDYRLNNLKRKSELLTFFLSGGDS
jgi:hypothetical protein